MSNSSKETKKCPSCDKDISVKAKKCPYCQKDLRNWFRRHPILTILFVLFISPFFLSGFSQGLNRSPGENTRSNTSTSPSIPPITQEYKDSLTKTFCSERSEPTVRAVNLDDYIGMFDKAGETVTLHPAKTKPTQANCKKAVDLCLDYWDKEDCERIAERKIWIGMNDNQLILSWGMPNDRNDTVGSWGIHTQWVYGDSDEYVYLEGKTKDDLRVTSWQN